MEHVQDFEEFLKNKVNLNKNRLQKLKRSTRAVTELLSRELDSYEKVERQGSYALGTTIKPIKGYEYDADILLYMKYNSDKEPKDYINEVYNYLKQNNNEDKIARKTRCVNINYAGDFHLDIVPCITQGQEQYICNEKENEFEVTDGTGYRDWFNRKTKITHGNLKGVTRLLKYLRDHKGNFSVKSILLTTLIGNSVYDDNDENFKNIPDTLKLISNRINSFLQSNPIMPEVCNPIMPDECFTRHWDQNKYKNFREKFAIYNNKIDEAFEATDHNTSVKKWRELFGENFGKLRDDKAIRSAASAIVTPRKPYAW